MAKSRANRPEGYDYSKEIKGGRLPGGYENYIQVPRSWLDTPKLGPNNKQPKNTGSQSDYAIVAKLKPAKTTIGTGPNKKKITPMAPAKTKGLPATGKTNLKKKK
jgi:hypothetical protein